MRTTLTVCGLRSVLILTFCGLLVAWALSPRLRAAEESAPKPPPGGAAKAGDSLDRACIVALWSYPRSPARPRAWRTLARLGPRAVPDLDRALRSGDPELWSGAREGLRVFPAAVPVLLPHLSDPDPAVRARVLGALSGLAPWWVERPAAEEVVRTAAALLPDADEEAARAALFAIEAAGPAGLRALPALAEYLRKAPDGPGERVARWARLMGRGAAPLAPILLDRALHSDGGFFEPWWEALAATGPGDGGALARIVELLPVAPAERKARALRVLAAWGEAAAPAVESVAGRLADPEERVRAAALDALVRIPGGETAAARYAMDLYVASPEQSRFAFRGLDELGSRYIRVMGELVATISSPNPGRRAAAFGLLTSAPDDLLTGPVREAARALASDVEEVRVSIAWSCFYRETLFPGEAELLETMLDDASSEVRGVAVLTIGRRMEKSRDRRWAERIAPLFEDPDPEVRFRVGNALEEIGVGVPASLPAILKNLRSANREVRLGAVRGAMMLGPGAAAAVPDLIRVIRTMDGGVGQVALYALADTEVMDDRVRSFLTELARGDDCWAAVALEAFAPRAGFLEEIVRAQILADQRGGFLPYLAGATRDPSELAAWIEEHEAGLARDPRFEACLKLGAPGLSGAVRLAAGGRAWWRWRVREEVRELQGNAARTLLVSAREEAPEAAGFAADLLAEVGAGLGVPDLLPLLHSPHPRVRAGAARAAAGLFRAGADARSALPALRRALDDDAPVRAAALHALGAARDAAEYVVARARSALGDPDPGVRVGAAEAVFLLTGETASPLRALEGVFFRPARIRAYMGGNGALPVTEEDFDADDRIWTTAARVLERMGPAAAPVAETLAWAARRDGDPVMVRILVCAIKAMGPDAAAAIPLLVRLRGSCGTGLFPRTVGDPSAEVIDRALAKLRGE